MSNLSRIKELLTKLTTNTITIDELMHSVIQSDYVAESNLSVMAHHEYHSNSRLMPGGYKKTMNPATISVRGIIGGRVIGKKATKILTRIAATPAAISAVPSELVSGVPTSADDFRRDAVSSVGDLNAAFRNLANVGKEVSVISSVLRDLHQSKAEVMVKDPSGYTSKAIIERLNISNPQGNLAGQSAECEIILKVSIPVQSTQGLGLLQKVKLAKMGF